MKEIDLLREFISVKGLRLTPQREVIARAFLATEKHLTVDELYRIVRSADKGIGYTTVYRTMKLMSDAGLCSEVDFGEGKVRFEHSYNHKHHDHLVCTRCGSFIEVFDPEIERLQEALVRRHGFLPMRHKLEIFGICQECANSRGKG